MANDLTYAAVVGWNEWDKPAPYIYSSPAFIAWAAGRWLKLTHRSFPRNVRMSRGYHIRANDMLLKWKDESEFERIN